MLRKYLGKQQEIGAMLSRTPKSWAIQYVTGSARVAAWQRGPKVFCCMKVLRLTVLEYYSTKRCRGKAGFWAGDGLPKLRLKGRAIACTFRLLIRSFAYSLNS